MKDPIDRLIVLTERKKAVKNSLDEVNAEIADVEAEIAARFRKDGTQSVNRNGTLVYMKRELTVRSTHGTDATVEALRKARLSDLISVQHQRLKAWVRERMYNARTDNWELNEKKLPPSLRAVIKCEEYHRIGVRKS
jgi:predicted DCC family thiol-disulfide oxidoreductase YuxK